MNFHATFEGFEAPVARVARVLGDACRVAALTGAGMSFESGVPTFREAQRGWWARYDPQELATPEAFQRHPQRVFGWYLERWRRARAAVPHLGHHALVALARRWDLHTVVTQNVDGLHQRAGSQNVVELHGSLSSFRCVARHPFDERLLESLPVDQPEVEPPSCAECGSPVRPGVVWFGEMLPPDELARASRAISECDVLLVIGTSALVYPAAALPHFAKARGAKVIEINPTSTPLSLVADVTWLARAGEALPALASALGCHAYS